MNYIWKLEQRVEELNLQRAVAWEQIAELKGYLCSSKFNCGNELDRYVNITDVLNRLNQIDLNCP